ncbi:hypothetical protein D9M73_277890 [compost metagenome]
MGIDHQTDRGTLLEVEQVLLDQPAVDHGIEPAVVDNVVNVTVDVVVHPACGDVAQVAIVFALVWYGFAHDFKSPVSRGALGNPPALCGCRRGASTMIKLASR